MIKEKINTLIQNAMKSGNKVDLSVYRAIKSTFTEFLTAKNAKLLDDIAEISLIKKMIKQRKDASEQYLIGNRKDLYNNEIAEINILETFLPQSSPASEIENYAKTIVFDKSLMGSYIKQLKEKFPYNESNEIVLIVKKLLNS